MSLEEEIKNLREQGKSYREIQAELKCSKAVISYFLNPAVKERTGERQRAKRGGYTLEPLRTLSTKPEPKPKPEREQRFCLGCNTTLSEEQMSWGSVFCSVKCSANHKFERSYQAWLAGEIVSNRNHTLAKFLKTRDGCICSVCKNDKWNDQNIPLEVDHVDGNHENCEISNLRLICPNCHAQTDTYKGKNRGNGRYARRVRYNEKKSY